MTIGNLLIERSDISFSIVDDAKIEVFDSKVVGLNPLVKLKGLEGKIKGLQSGQRSGLVEYNKQLFKFKGVDIKNYLSGEVLLVYNYRNEPLGGQGLTIAKHEIEITHEYNQIMPKEGYPRIYEPAALITYNLEYLLMHSNRTFVISMIENAKKNWATVFHRLIGETDYTYEPEDNLIDLNQLEKIENVDSLNRYQFGASVMQIKGDTRIPEIYRLMKDNEASREFSYLLGIYVGAIKRIFDNFFVFGLGSSHLGNFAVFEDHGQIHVDMVDFPITTKKGRKFDSVRSFLNNGRICTSSLEESWTLVEGKKVTEKNDIAPGYFITNFLRGASLGYINPNNRKPIPKYLFKDALS